MKIRHFFLVAALLTSSSAFGIILLDDVMSRSEQKKIGVNKMSLDQKRELEDWLNRNFVVKNKAQEPPPQPNLSLSINVNNGQQLQLSDGTFWVVDPDDVSVAFLWISPVPIQIAPSDSSDYPSLLINKNNGTSVKAKKIRQVTPPAVQQPAAS